MTAYSGVIQEVDGQQAVWKRRERPHMVWALRGNLSEAPVPLALSTAVTAMPTCETDLVSRDGTLSLSLSLSLSSG